ncbi:MAG: hypothetical protein LBP91_04840 [Coriobacteriales bacterium]|jgi:hypothetical protein|nr:hypothetical protein [Coriobacteriales bacterium]
MIPNIIRTKAIELSTIPALAYKQKLASGGAGIKILRTDGLTAVCTIDKRSSDMLPYGSFDETLFPLEAFDEAFELTNGLPFSARGNIKVVEIPEIMPDDVHEEAPEEQVDMTLSPEYRAIVERYSDEKGRLNYTLMNKDFIQFAARSRVVSSMVGEGASQEDILLFIVNSRASEISRQRESLDSSDVLLLIESLDEMNPRSAFKELRAHINRMLSRGKQQRR